MDIGHANIGDIHLQWTEEDNLCLVNAWLNVPIDFVIGNENTARDFWNQVAEEYNANTADNRRRQPIQIKRRWSKMSSEILLFDGMWRRVDDAFTATGQYNQGLVSKSLEMYRLEQNQSFKFLNMWMFIRNYP